MDNVMTSTPWVKVSGTSDFAPRYFFFWHLALPSSQRKREAFLRLCLLLAVFLWEGREESEAPGFLFFWSPAPLDVCRRRPVLLVPVIRERERERNWSALAPPHTHTLARSHTARERERERDRERESLLGTKLQNGEPNAHSWHLSLYSFNVII